ncbi:MAG: N-formylglutamate amidohydrolase [Synergistales bacterium]|nr:N-formylglutamate amidohydrolase [Synergistales bacterium]
MTMSSKAILVVIPHSGVVIPSEIPAGSLSEDFPQLVQNVDWYTNWLYDFRDILGNVQEVFPNWLYDFRDILGNVQEVFPYCSMILEANRHPDVIEDCVPLVDVKGRPVYREGLAPSAGLREEMSRKYLRSFHARIGERISEGAVFLFDGHSSLTARGVEDNQIEIMNYQNSYMDEEPLRFSPPEFIEIYADQLRRRLPEVKVTVNESEYYTVYGHVCAAHSVNSRSRVGARVPAIIQETNEHLYKRSDRTPDVLAIDRLRRAFAGSLAEMLRLIGLQ